MQAKLLAAAIGEETSKAYKSAIKHWHRLCKAKGWNAKSFSEDKLEGYLAFRIEAEAGNSYSSLNKELAAMKDWATAIGSDWERESNLVAFNKMRKGFRRLSKKPQHYLAFPKDKLKEALEKLSIEGTQQAMLQHVYLSFMFCSMCRNAETSAKRANTRSALCWEQVSFSPNASKPDFVEVQWSNSKTNQFGVRTDRAVLHCSCGMGICGLHALAALRKSIKHYDARQAVFKTVKGRPIRQCDARKFVARARQLAGLPATRMSVHSLRGGGATALFELGVSVAAIEKMGRWSPGSKALRVCYIKFALIRASKEASDKIKANTASWRT